MDAMERASERQLSGCRYAAGNDEIWVVFCRMCAYSKRMKSLGAMLVLPLLGCATAAVVNDNASVIAAPTAEEIIAHVEASWSADYRYRFANFASRRGDPAELLSVSNVICGTYDGHPNCSFDVNGKFADGSEKLVNLSSTFDRDENGRLRSIVLLLHERRN
ncbi:hypothetical protein MACH24_26680 [Erythrobacter sp. Dej080120_24]|uniref:hypothetical protein n=1 Tax=Erythrobacter sp. Dej080120_24 TaxID=3024837 RepID=UPI002923E04B|nr:hypothetical protein MACH24_26680 [Erythrobacter sp. Dej080120_24]